MRKSSPAPSRWLVSGDRSFDLDRWCRTPRQQVFSPNLTQLTGRAMVARRRDVCCRRRRRPDDARRICCRLSSARPAGPVHQIIPSSCTRRSPTLFHTRACTTQHTRTCTVLSARIHPRPARHTTCFCNRHGRLSRIMCVQNDRSSP